MNHGIPDPDIRRIREALCAFPSIQRAWLYGSRAMGTHRKGSDIDLALETTDPDSTRIASIADALDDLLLPWELDVILLSHIDNPGLRDHIRRVGIPLYQREC